MPEKKWTKRSKQLHIKHAFVRDESAEGRGRAGFCYPVANLQEGERMTQGAVKTTGKRSRAVSAKKKAILSAALDTFHNSVFTAQGWSRSRSWRVFQNQSAVLLSVKEALYIAVLRQILDIWLAPLKAFREDFAPLAAIKEYIRLKLEVSRDYPQASRLFCMEMLAGAPLLMDELTGDLKALIDENRRSLPVGLKAANSRRLTRSI